MQHAKLKHDLHSCHELICSQHSQYLSVPNVPSYPRYMFHYTLRGYVTQTWTSQSCFLFEFFLETTPQIFHTASNWLTLALAVQRYIYVCHASLAKRFCTVHQARLVVMCLVCLAVIHMVPRILDREYSIQSVENPPCSGIHESVCVVKFGKWLDLISVQNYFKMFFW